jgi:hypothetical protein
VEISPFGFGLLADLIVDGVTGGLEQFGAVFEEGFALDALFEFQFGAVVRLLRGASGVLFCTQFCSSALNSRSLGRAIITTVCGK